MGVKKNKSVTKIIEALEKLYGPIKQSKKQPSLLDQLILQILQVEEKGDRAKKAFDMLKNEFVDWNEVRVTQPREIQELLEKHLCCQVGKKAHQLRDTLTQIFHLCNRMDLQFLLDKDFTEIHKFVVEDLGIGGEFFLHFILGQVCAREDLAVSPNFLRVGKRVGLWDENMTSAIVKKTMQKQLGVKSYAGLHLLFFLHGEYVCLASNYDCSTCAILKFCDWGKKRMDKQSAPRATTKKRKQTEKKTCNTQTRSRQKQKNSTRGIG